MPRKHIVITGTGRTGTTFLVQLLTELGLDTGFLPEDLQTAHYDKHARAGLEQDIRNDNAPFVIKSPWFCDHAKEALDRTDIEIDHVFIPMRDLNAAAESRRYVVRQVEPNTGPVDPTSLPGGLWHTTSEEPGAQEQVLLHQVYKLLLALSASMVPITVMHYPRIVKDDSYLFQKLKPVLGGISFTDFQTAFNKTARPEMTHRFSEGDQ